MKMEVTDATQLIDKNNKRNSVRIDQVEINGDRGDPVLLEND